MRPVTVPVEESILSRRLEDLEPPLIWHGYTVQSPANQFSTKPADVRHILRGEPCCAKAQELTRRMRIVGLPL